jgi:hypothetical protein
MKKFHTLGMILLAVGVIWLLQELGVLTIDIPWIPIVVIIIALGMIINRMLNK